MTILDKIIANKKQEVALSKTVLEIEVLKNSLYFSRTCENFAASILSRSGIIAEFKRKSPSKGVINAHALSNEVAKEYEQAGASAVSVLTDTKFFGGTFNDLLLAREAINIPILRKDFMIDAYQLYEAKALGADVILLIAAGLEQNQSKELAHEAKSLGLNVFLELHTDEELVYFNEFIDVVGINNRNLKTFQVDIENSIRLAKALPKEVVKVAESGIAEIATLQRMKKKGFEGFLIGENFMKTQNPGQACEDFIQQIK